MTPTFCIKQYTNEGDLVSQTTPVYPQLDDNYGYIHKFQDLEGRFSLLINDRVNVQSTYELWLTRHLSSTETHPTLHIVTCLDWDNSIEKRDGRL